MPHCFKRLSLVTVSLGLSAMAALACTASHRDGGNTSANDSLGDDAGPGPDSGADPDGSCDPDSGCGSNASADAPTDSCYGLFRWLQKDAYKNTGGRNDPAWPPHTTTVMEVHCVDSSGNDQIVASAFRDNHGSDPGTFDTNGNPMLTQVKVSDPAYAPQAQLMALLGEYQQCECAPATPFLSMTDAEGPLESQILSAVISYMQENLTCSGAVSTSQFIGFLQSGDFDDAAADFQDCSWNNGATFEEGLDQAAASVLASLSSTLNGYHVCNNDAILESQQWSTFVSTGNVVACDNTQSICHGPTWFYTP
jgi:hypothetical protein